MSSKSSKAKPESATWPIDQLTPHPKQAEYFGDLSSSELEALKASISRNGLESPVHVLPDGVIIKGHQRVRACRELGRTEIEVMIRHDLAGAAAAVEREMIGDNLDRRQLDPIDIGILTRRMLQLEKKLEGASKGSRGSKALREQLAARFGMTTRNLERLVALADLPPAIQQAVKRKALTLDAAAKIAKLDKAQQTEIAKQLRQQQQNVGKSPGLSKKAVRAIVRPFLEQLPTPAKKPPADPFAALVRDLARAVTQLRGQEDAVDAASITTHLQTLNRGRVLLRNLVGRADPPQQ